MGKIGEELVEFYLIREGKIILEKNYFCRYGEIDIIAKDNNELLFVEVKTRTTKDGTYGDPLYSITPKKQKHLISSALCYISEKNLDLPFRFDVAVVISNKKENKISYFENVIVN